MNRQPHYIVITSAYGFDSHTPYPFLYAIGTGLVIRQKIFHIIFYGFIRKVRESDFSSSRK